MTHQWCSAMDELNRHGPLSRLPARQENFWGLSSFEDYSKSSLVAELRGGTLKLTKLHRLNTKPYRPAEPRAAEEQRLERWVQAAPTGAWPCRCPGKSWKPSWLWGLRAMGNVEAALRKCRWVSSPWDAQPIRKEHLALLMPLMIRIGLVVSGKEKYNTAY